MDHLKMLLEWCLDNKATTLGLILAALGVLYAILQYYKSDKPTTTNKTGITQSHTGSGNNVNNHQTRNGNTTVNNVTGNQTNTVVNGIQVNAKFEKDGSND